MLTDHYANPKDIIKLAGSLLRVKKGVTLFSYDSLNTRIALADELLLLLSINEGSRSGDFSRLHVIQVATGQARQVVLAIETEFFKAFEVVVP